MSESYPYVLVLVDGPSEARGGDPQVESGGIVRAIVAYVFGAEVAMNIRVAYWSRTPRSPLRTSADGHRICPRAAQVRHAVAVACATTAYGAVVLADNDH